MMHKWVMIYKWFFNKLNSKTNSKTKKNESVSVCPHERIILIKDFPWVFCVQCLAPLMREEIRCDRKNIVDTFYVVEEAWAFIREERKRRDAL
jgi:hypothetical protein